MRIIGLDVGTKRIGVAKVDTTVKIATPDYTIPVDGNELREIARLARENNTNVIVVGLPRSNQGVETAQSTYSRQFAKKIKDVIPDARIFFQDESLTSIEAENRLKARKKRYAKGEIDAEAASIILQDFIESAASSLQNTPPAPPEPPKSVAAPVTNKNTITIKESPKMPKKRKKPTYFLLTFIVICFVVGFFGFYWYHDCLKPVYTGSCTSESTAPECEPVAITISEGETAPQVAEALKSADLIRSSVAFQLQLRLSGKAQNIRTGDYLLMKTLSVTDIIDILVNGPQDEVFSLMLRPGETLMDFEKILLEQGYSQQEISAALVKNYDHPLLKDKPAGVSLEGYLYGDTYEFYKGESVEHIIKRLLDEMYSVVTENSLAAAFEAQGLNLHEGITLASIVQRESVADSEDYAKVAQVFLSRLAQGLKLGSDVTTQYALDLVDPDRAVYSDNAAALSVDSPYNTRKYSGLPPGAISSPSLEAMQAVAHPSDTAYLYFLTGDDGMMYYSYTESEHNQNAAKYCQELCNVSL